MFELFELDCSVGHLHPNLFPLRARGMEHFTSRAHHGVFLFVAEERDCCETTTTTTTPPSWGVRGFRLTRGLELREETDASLVSSAWGDFKSSHRASHSVDEKESLVQPVGGMPSRVARGLCDLKTNVCVSSWSTVAHYASSTVDGRLVFGSACNVFSGSMHVPLLVPKSELPQRSTGSQTPTGGGAPAAKRHKRMPTSRALHEHVLRQPVMPVGWYRKNLIGARIHAIELYRDKSRLVCEMLDGRAYRFREHFPDMPVSKQERRGGNLTADDDEEGVHDDVAPTPNVFLAHVARWRDDLHAHRHNLALIDC